MIALLIYTACFSELSVAEYFFPIIKSLVRFWSKLNKALPVYISIYTLICSPMVSLSVVAGLQERSLNQIRQHSRIESKQEERTYFIKAAGNVGQFYSQLLQFRCKVIALSHSNGHINRGTQLSWTQSIFFQHHFLGGEHLET